MAKKQLAIPKAPPGPQFDFFMAMQELVLHAGNPSCARIAAMVGKSHSAVYNALVGPRLPSVALLDAMVAKLTPDTVDGDQLTSTLKSMHHLARADARAIAATRQDLADRLRNADTEAVPEGVPTHWRRVLPRPDDAPLPNTQSRRADAGRARRQGKNTVRLIEELPPKQRAFHIELGRIKYASGRSNASIAEQAGVSAATVDAWLAGLRFPALRSLDKFSRVFGLDPEHTVQLTDLWTDAARERQVDTNPVSEPRPETVPAGRPLNDTTAAWHPRWCVRDKISPIADGGHLHYGPTVTVAAASGGPVTVVQSCYQAPDVAGDYTIDIIGEDLNFAVTGAEARELAQLLRTRVTATVALVESPGLPITVSHVRTTPRVGTRPSWSSIISRPGSQTLLGSDTWAQLDSAEPIILDDPHVEHFVDVLTMLESHLQP